MPLIGVVVEVASFVTLFVQFDGKWLGGNFPAQKHLIRRDGTSGVVGTTIRIRKKINKVPWRSFFHGQEHMDGCMWIPGPR